LSLSPGPILPPKPPSSPSSSSSPSIELKLPDLAAVGFAERTEVVAFVGFEEEAVGLSSSEDELSSASVVIGLYFLALIR
jgi:hypothetical protein